jgi:hypothetical protein
MAMTQTAIKPTTPTALEATIPVALKAVTPIATKATTQTTLCLLTGGSRYAFRRYVDRVFSSEESAMKFKAQFGKVMIVRIDGNWKAGDKVPRGTTLALPRWTR